MGGGGGGGGEVEGRKREGGGEEKVIVRGGGGGGVTVITPLDPVIFVAINKYDTCIFFLSRITYRRGKSAMHYNRTE